MSTQTLPEIAAPATTWSIDPVHSSVEFKVRHMMISNVKGQFKGVTGTLKLDSADLTKSEVEVSIDAASINTNDAQRDARLKSADFFDAEKFPTLIFKSNRISRNQDGTAKVAGELSIHGVPRKVVLEVEALSASAKDPWGNTRIGFSATTRVNRKDFGLTWNAALETGGIMVGDEVAITLDIQFIKA